MSAPAIPATPDVGTSTETISQLIVNSPYAEPERHWRYERETRRFTLDAGRRPAGYVRATPGSRSFDDPGIFEELPLVNQIRGRVRAWRDTRRMVTDRGRSAGRPCRDCKER